MFGTKKKLMKLKHEEIYINLEHISSCEEVQ